MPPAPPTGRLDVTWHASIDDIDLARVVADLADIVPDAVRIVRSCRSCGSDQHGKPHVIAPTAAMPLHVSVSRSDGLTVVAVTDVGPVGVDVEAIQGEDLMSWVRTESLVKATGHGLTIDPDDIADDRWTADLDAPDGYVGAVTILSTTPPSTITNPAAPAG